MNFEGAKPLNIPRYGSSCEWDDETNLPLGLARIARNVRYTAQAAATRFGHKTRLQILANDRLTAGGLLRYLAPQPGTLDLQAVETILLFAYAANAGSIFSAPPFLQGQLKLLTDGPFFAHTGLTAEQLQQLHPIMVQGFNKLFIALGDLLLPVHSPLVYNSSDAKLYGASMLPFAAPWQPGRYYNIGEVISPSAFETFGQTDGQGAWVEKQTGHVYQCTLAGISGNVQPVWPTTPFAAVADNTAIFTENTPIFISGLPDSVAPSTPVASASGGSPILPGATLYLCCTMLNGKGEGTCTLSNVKGELDTSKVLKWTNDTGGAVTLQITMPAIPALLTGNLPDPFAPTGLNLYAFIDADSSADPAAVVDPAYYAQVNTDPLAGGAVVVLNAYPAGSQLPQTSTAQTTDKVGNVDTGLRYMAVFFQSVTRYQSGFSNSGCFPVNVSQSGWPIQVLNLPMGPYSSVATVVAATVAGSSAAGPYRYISRADVESPGFNQPNVEITSTLFMNTEIATSGSFDWGKVGGGIPGGHGHWVGVATLLLNFTDTYLPGASDVTDWFDIIELPPCVDLYFAKSLRRMVYTGAVGYQSGHLFSDIDNPEMVRVPGGNFQVSESDGDRTVCLREIRGVPFSFKENSGHVVETNGGDPSTWGVRKVWEGNGPAGPAAIDIAGQDDTEFAIWAHRSGAYMFAGNAPALIGREQHDTWNRINWNCGHLIKCRIDRLRRLVHFLVPLDGSVTINARLTMNYYFGMGDPVVFVPRRGVLVPNVEGRKWSRDDVSFEDALYIPQKSASAVQGVGVNVDAEMVFFAADGSIKTVEEGQYWDEDFDGNHTGYFSTWVGVLGQLPGMSYGKLVGARMWVMGAGYLVVTAYDDNNIAVPLTILPDRYPDGGPKNDMRMWFWLGPEGRRIRADLPAAEPSPDSMRWSVGMDNGGVAGAWWEVLRSDLMIQPNWPGLPG